MPKNRAFGSPALVSRVVEAQVVLKFKKKAKKMTLTRERILDSIRSVSTPGGGDLVSRDLVRAIQVDGANVRFVIEAESTDAARMLESARAEAEVTIRALEGVGNVSVVLTAHGPAPAAPSRAGPIWWARSKVSIGP